jgi:cobalamin biosynthetic protein CobC
MKRLVHGGQLQQLAKIYQIPAEQWLDLSTGISPLSYPIPEIPIKVWQQLPDINQELLTAGRYYYGSNQLVASNGSQAIISKLPQLLVNNQDKKITVWLPKVGYKEHEKAWHSQQLKISHYDDLPTLEQLSKNCIVVVINPNNPTGKLQSRACLHSLLEEIQTLNGFLIVDEAFMDVIVPTQSLIDLIDNKHLFVLRSIGKFFGLAGIRLGFLNAHQYWLDKLAELANPWEVNGPAQFVATKALRNRQWQQHQLTSLRELADNLTLLLSQAFNQIPKGTLLFQTVSLINAPQIFDLLCKQGIYVRLCDEQNALRFGIPLNDDLQKLRLAFEQVLSS